MKVRRKKGSLVHRIIIYLLLLFFVGILLFPLFYSFINSFKASGEALAGMHFWPEQWKWQNYLEAWDKANFATYTKNTVMYAFAITVLCVLSDSICGYVFARGKFPGKKLILAMKSSMMFIAFGSVIMFPQMQILQKLHLTNIPGLVIVAVSSGSIAYIYMVRAFVLSLPKELDEAATIDGCSFMGVFFRITLPLIKPIVATIAVLYFKYAWNDYLFPMIVTFGAPEKRTLSVGLYTLQTATVSANWGLMLAGSMIAAVPLIIIYAFLNRFFLESIAEGAVKG